MANICTRAFGFSVIELLFATAVAATLVGVAIPLTGQALDAIRTAGAARHVAGKIATARIDAVRRSATAALRFEADRDDYVITTHADGNGNGVRTTEIQNAVDATIGAPERLSDNYPAVRFGLRPGIPDLDGAYGSEDGVRIGSARILSLSPNGSATPGTLYVRGRRAQYAVRVLGATGRVRVFQYDDGARRWNSK